MQEDPNKSDNDTKRTGLIPHLAYIILLIYSHVYY